ncbi:MAG: hypothetical protein DRN20_06795 [Thermoplasmata archaeon]|nr:MAG: hypothetical protein DRN20_06795 [Thermoplasmata archaeon]
MRPDTYATQRFKNLSPFIHPSVAPANIPIIQGRSTVQGQIENLNVQQQTQENNLRNPRKNTKDPLQYKWKD